MKQQFASAKQRMKIVALIGFAVLFFGVTARGVGAQEYSAERRGCPGEDGLRMADLGRPLTWMCKASCPSDAFRAGVINPVLHTNLNENADKCTGADLCCVQRNSDLCLLAAKKIGRDTDDQSGSCQNKNGATKCFDGYIDIKQAKNAQNIPITLDLCSGNYLCCVKFIEGYDSANVAPVTTDCVNGKLSGFPSECKAARGTNNTTFTHAYQSTLSQYYNQCDGGASSCYLKRGDELCASVARKHGEGDPEFAFLEPLMTLGNATAYLCSKESDCDTKQGKAIEWPALDSPLCPDGQVCCPGKRSADVTPTTPAPKATPKELPDPLGGVTIHVLIGNIIRGFAGIVGSIALLMFIWGGISMIMAGGDSGKVTKARTILMNATGGIILIFTAYLFVSAIIDAILAN